MTAIIQGIFIAIWRQYFNQVLIDFRKEMKANLANIHTCLFYKGNRFVKLSPRTLVNTYVFCTFKGVQRNSKAGGEY